MRLTSPPLATSPFPPRIPPAGPGRPYWTTPPTLLSPIWLAPHSIHPGRQVDGDGCVPCAVRLLVVCGVVGRRGTYDLRGKGTCLVRPSGASAAVVGAGPDCRVAGGCGRFQCPRGGCEGVGAGYHSGPVARSAFHPLRPSRWGSHGRFPATQQTTSPAMQLVQCRAGSRRTGPTRGPPRRIGAVRPRDRGASGARLFALGPRRWCRTPITAGCVWLPPIQDGDRC